VKSKDAVGNLAVSGDFTFTTLAPPDTTVPTVSLTAPAASSTVSGTVTVSASATDNVGVVGVQFKLDGVNLGAEVTAAPYALAWITTTASNGAHSLTAVARDAAGNTVTATAVSVTVDNAAPVISAVSSSGVGSSAATITWTTDEASDSQVEYGLTSAYGQVSALASPLVSSHSVGLSGLSASTVYHYRVKSKDAMGNLAVSGDFTFTTLAPPDTTVPIVSLTAPVAGATVAGTVSVSASATDNVGVVGVQFKLDGVNLGTELTVAPYVFSWNTATTTNGSHSLTAVARDAAGNTATATAVSVTVDNAAPVISAVLSSGVGSSSTTISWTTNEASDSQVEYGLTSAYGQVSALASPLVSSHSVGLSGLSASTVYHYRVKSKDAMGNLAVSGDVTVTTLAPPDTTVPTVSLTAPVAGVTVAGTITVSASATDNVGVVGVQFKLDGTNLGTEVTAAPYTLAWITTTASNGTHSLTAVARDAAGNTATSTAVSVTVDNAAPVLSAVSSSIVGSSAATITWTTNEASDSQVEYGLTSAYGQVSALASPLVSSHSVGLSGLSASTVYHYRVKSRDAAGNLATSADFTFTTAPLGDTTPPTVSIVLPAAGATVSGTVTVLASATDNVGVVGVQFKLDGVNLGTEDTVAPYSVSWNTSLASKGTHTLTAVARDAAGNTTTSSSVTVTVTLLVF
jgi:phosphodiesterase/alkaline phosphatase D-like protein